MLSKSSSQTIQNILSIRNNKNVMTTTRTCMANMTTTTSCTSSIGAQSYQSKRMITTATITTHNRKMQQQHHHHHNCHYPNPKQLQQLLQKVQFFHTESDFHHKVDDTLYTIQDTLESFMEDNANSNSNLSSSTSFEINYASGVLTISLPPHGTWVLNKQTPNQQIWWSSPITGPRRFEYNEKDDLWVWTKDESLSLGKALKEEMIDLFHLVDEDDGLLDELNNL